MPNPEFRLHARDSTTGQSTRNDEIEVGQIRTHVDGQAMHRHPSADTHAHRADLPSSSRIVTDPYASGALVTKPLKVVSGQCPDDDLLEPSQIRVQTKLESIQIQNRIGDQLPGTVPRDVPASIGWLDLHSTSRQLIVTGQ